MASVLVLIDAWCLDVVDPAPAFSLGVLAGVLFDRLVLWPLALWLSRRMSRRA